MYKIKRYASLTLAALLFIGVFGAVGAQVFAQSRHSEAQPQTVSQGAELAAVASSQSETAVSHTASHARAHESSNVVSSNIPKHEDSGGKQAGQTQTQTQSVATVSPSASASDVPGTGAAVQPSPQNSAQTSAQSTPQSSPQASIHHSVSVSGGDESRDDSGEELDD